MAQRVGPSPLRREGRHRAVRPESEGQSRRHLAASRPAPRRQGTGAAAGAWRRMGHRHATAAGLPTAEPSRRPRLDLPLNRLPRQPQTHLAGPHRRRQARAGLDQGAHRRVRRDPDFIAIAGGSAGGHLCSLAALTPDDPQYQPGFEDADTSVRAAVPIYGRYDWFTTRGSGRKEFIAFLQKFVVKKPFREHKQVYVDASPIKRLRPDAPPFFILHGQDDSIIPVPEGREFAQALREVSTSPVVYAEIPHAQHAFDFYYGSPRAHYTAQAVEEFLHWVQASRQAIK